MVKHVKVPQENVKNWERLTEKLLKMSKYYKRKLKISKNPHKWLKCQRATDK